MKQIYPDNALAVGKRRRAGDHLLALAIAVDRPAAGSEWIAGSDTDWIGVLADAPVAAFEFPMVAGLCCVVHGRAGSKRGFAVADRLFKAAASEVWMEQPEGLYRLQRIVPGKPVVAEMGPLSPAQVLSALRARRLARGVAA